MLALTRKVGEQIVIGDDIVITVAGVKGESVRLTIEAPKEVKIYRKEIYDEIAAENKQAAMPSNLAELDILKGLHKKNY